MDALGNLKLSASLEWQTMRVDRQISIGIFIISSIKEKVLLPYHKRVVK